MSRTQNNKGTILLVLTSLDGIETQHTLWKTILFIQNWPNLSLYCVESDSFF